MPDIFVAEQKTEDLAQNKKEVLSKEPVLAAEIPDKNSGSVHLFTSYCQDPDDITFENQDEDEKVLLFIRKDFITNLSWIISGAFLLTVPLLITPVLMFLHLPFFVLPEKYLIVLIIFYYLFVTTFVFISFITWYFNIDIVTEKRIIDIEFEGIVYKNVAATKLTLVQDVSYAQVGVTRTIFDYGDVLIQTAGTIDNFTFEAVPRPEDAVHVVENLIGKRNEQL
jgi:hypothetical protein